VRAYLAADSLVQNAGKGFWSLLQIACHIYSSSQIPCVLCIHLGVFVVCLVRDGLIVMYEYAVIYEYPFTSVALVCGVGIRVEWAGRWLVIR